MHIFELDVHMTKDDQIVVTHDANLSRLTNEEINVNDIKFG